MFRYYEKVLSTAFIMLFMASFANAISLEKIETFKNCHALACQAVVDFESVSDLDEDSAEFIYDAVYSSCNG